MKVHRFNSTLSCDPCKGLARTGFRRKRSKKQSRREREWSRLKRQAIAERGDVCEPCKTHPDPRCSGRADDAHHKAGRVGPQSLDVLLLTGRFHHDYIESHRTEARRLGWSVSRNEVTQ